MKPEQNSKVSQIQRDLPDDIVNHIAGFVPQQNADDRWKEERVFHETPIMEELSYYQETLGIRTGSLVDAHAELNTQNNIIVEIKVN